MACGEDRVRHSSQQGVCSRGTHKSHTARHSNQKTAPDISNGPKVDCLLCCRGLVNISAHQYASKSRYSRPDHLLWALVYCMLFADTVLLCLKAFLKSLLRPEQVKIHYCRRERHWSASHREAGLCSTHTHTHAWKRALTQPARGNICAHALTHTTELPLSLCKLVMKRPPCLMTITAHLTWLLVK